MFEKLKKEGKTIAEVLIKSFLNALVWITIFYLIVGPYNETFRIVLEIIKNQEVNLSEICIPLFGIFMVVAIIINLAKVIISRDEQKAQIKKTETNRNKRK